MRIRAAALVVVALLAACVRTEVREAPTPGPVEVIPPPQLPTPPAIVPGAMLPTAPALPREFRAVWVATVANIDWPSRPGLPVAQQKAELLAILDQAASLGLNAVIFQVRPGADALYASQKEPWSYFLTGTMGKAPEPFYDPLEFAVREAHARGLELHAWFNPYRAKHPSVKGPIAAAHVSRARPTLVKTYGTHLWMDPGLPAVQDLTVEVVLDVVRRYDIDGVHIDDYFYPYQERDRRGRVIPFPDDASYGRYRSAGGRLSRDDWRRENVNTLVARLYREIKEEKRWVKFGISPFGIWRPGYPAGVSGLDAYATLYADARKWLVEGWVDYFSPQLYWRIAAEGQSYPRLLSWWSEQNAFGRHLWPGNYIDRVGDSQRWPVDEIVRQVELTRADPGASGNVFFSMKTLQRNPSSLSDRLRTTVYDEPALVPASPWLGEERPLPPAVSARRALGSIVLDLIPDGEEPVRWWAVQTLGPSGWKTRVVDGAVRSVVLPESGDWVAVRAVGRTGIESEVVAARAE